MGYNLFDCRSVVREVTGKKYAPSEHTVYLGH
jgi:hypothetical protein